MHLVPPDVDVRVVIRRLCRRTDLVDEGQRLAEAREAQRPEQALPS